MTTKTMRSIGTDVKVYSSDLVALWEPYQRVEGHSLTQMDKMLVDGFGSIKLRGLTMREDTEDETCTTVVVKIVRDGPTEKKPMSSLAPALMTVIKLSNIPAPWDFLNAEHRIQSWETEEIFTISVPKRDNISLSPPDFTHCVMSFPPIGWKHAFPRESTKVVYQSTAEDYQAFYWRIEERAALAKLEPNSYFRYNLDAVRFWRWDAFSHMHNIDDTATRVDRMELNKVDKPTDADEWVEIRGSNFYFRYPQIMCYFERHYNSFNGNADLMTFFYQESQEAVDHRAFTLIGDSRSLYFLQQDRDTVVFLPIGLMRPLKGFSNIVSVCGFVSGRTSTESINYGLIQNRAASPGYNLTTFNDDGYTAAQGSTIYRMYPLLGEHGSNLNLVRVSKVAYSTNYTNHGYGDILEAPILAYYHSNARVVTSIETPRGYASLRQLRVSAIGPADEEVREPFAVQTDEGVAMRLPVGRGQVPVYLILSKGDPR